MADIGRNDPCPCNSGKKYKKCCEGKDQAKQHAALEKQWNASIKAFDKQKKDAEENPESADPSATPKKPTSHPTSNIKQQKHNIPTAPKFSIPRKAGGGA